MFDVDSILDYSEIKSNKPSDYDSNVYDYDSVVNYFAVYREGKLITKYREEDDNKVKAHVKLTRDQTIKLMGEMPLIKNTLPVVISEYKLDYYGYNYEFDANVYISGDKIAKKVTLSVNFYNNIDEYKGHKDFTITGYTVPGEYMSAKFDVYERNWSNYKVVGCKTIYIDDTSSTKFVDMDDISERQEKWKSENTINLVSIVPLVR